MAEQSTPLVPARRRPTGGDGARADGYVSLAVVASAIAVAAGFERADPIIGLLITLVILRITWDSWRVISTTEPGEQHLTNH